jgi:3-oxoacyl-[acyl-carrier protein] reductase
MPVASGRQWNSHRNMRTVIVTGVSRGLGLAVSARLLKDGYRVAGLGRGAGGFAALVKDNPDRASFHLLDLSDIPGIAEGARSVIKACGPIYGLVNNAALGLNGLFAATRQSDIDALIATNLVGPMVLTKAVARSMMARREGRIVNISSITASTGFSGLAVYGATKAGLEGFTRSLSRELGKVNITVNAVAPGYMETAMSQGLDEEKMASVRRRAPLGLPATTDAAGAVAYLLGDDGARITGTVITVDGGSTA